MVATAAMHGVYSRQNTMKVNAASGVMAERTAAVPPYTTAIMDTTLSFARKPEIKAVTICQFPKPSGMNSGARNPASAASMLDWGSETMFMEKLKFCRNHTTMVPIKMTENARCRKSFALSHMSCRTLFAPGIR